MFCSQIFPKNFVNLINIIPQVHATFVDSYQIYITEVIIDITRRRNKRSITNFMPTFNFQTLIIVIVEVKGVL